MIEDNENRNPSEYLSAEQVYEQPAGFGIRLGAFLIDAVILDLLLLPILIATYATSPDKAHLPILTLQISFGLGALVYFVGCTVWAGTTPGKAALGLRVAKRNGDAPDPGTAILREVVGRFVSSIALYIGYLSVLWDKDSLAWHDHIAKTVVLKSRRKVGRGGTVGPAVAVLALSAFAGAMLFFVNNKAGASGGLKPEGFALTAPGGSDFFDFIPEPNVSPDEQVMKKPDVLLPRSGKNSKWIQGPKRVRHAYLANELANRGQVTQAKKELHEAEATPIDPQLDDAPTYAFLDARAHFVLDTGDWHKDVEMLREALQYSQTNLRDDCAILAAELYLQHGEADKAEKLITNITETDSTRFTLKVLKAGIKFDRKDYDGALAILKDIEQEYPRSARLEYNLGVVCHAQTNLDEALTHYNKAIALNPNFGPAYNNLGVIQSLRGDSAAAFDSLHQASLLAANDKLIGDNLSSITKSGPTIGKDDLEGGWIVDGGSDKAEGTANGKPVSIELPVPAGSNIVITKIGDGSYKWAEMGMETSMRLQPDGSYVGKAMTMDVPGVTYENNKVVFWHRGDRLFGDTTALAKGKGGEVLEVKTWKAHRKTP